MKKHRIILLSILFIFILGACGGGNDDVKAELDKRITEKMDGVCEALNEYDLTDVTWEITNIEKVRDGLDTIYNVWVTVNCTTGSTFYSDNDYWFADSIEHRVPEDFYTSKGWKVTTRYDNPNTSNRNRFESLVTINVNGRTIQKGMSPESVKAGSTKTSGEKSLSDSYGHTKYDAISESERTVKSQLKSPSTAKFCKTSEYKISCSGNTWTVSGYVDAQNSFGATLRSDFTVKITFTGSEEYIVESCTID